MRRSDSKEQTAKGSSEAALIRRAAQGDVEAFNRLVLRHRQSVLHFAWTMVRDWDLAEDLAQQTLLEAYRGLSGLREPQKFRAWLLTIARRRAMRHWGSLASQPPTIEFTESVIYPLTHEPSLPAADYVQDRIRESLLELSSRNRQVMVLHYLDGYSCNEISNRLSIPAGTVKRILHESRNHLRTGMGIAAKVPHPGGGLSKMETKKKLGPRNLQWWINGDWPGPVIGGLLSQSICLAINKKAKTAAQIAKDIDANAAYVGAEIKPLVHEGLVTKTRNGRYAVDFILLDASDWIEITQEVRRYGVQLADALLPHLPALEEAWSRTPQPEQGFPWSEGIWPTLAILVCNRGVFRNAPPRPRVEAPTHGSGKPYWAGGREVVGPEHVLWCVGWSLSGAQDGRLGYGHFWSYGLDRRYPAGWPDDRGRILFAMAQGASDVETIADKACLTSETVRDVVANMIEIGLAERKGDRLRLTFPVFDQADSDILTPTVDAVAARLSGEVLELATARLPDELRRLGYGHLESQFDAWRDWLKGNVCGEAIHELLKRGVLPDPGNPAPAGFCHIGWTRDLRLLSSRG